MGDVNVRVSETIGSTPTVALNRISRGLAAQVLVKLESRNPAGSVKDRIARSMIDDAERTGRLVAGRSTIVEPTSGNTGIALAMIGAERGYRVVLTMPESMSVERRRLLAAFGAELVLTPRERGMQGSVDAAQEYLSGLDDAVILGQFENPANPRAHFETTGPEIVSALGEARLGAFVAGVGTGGTVSGVGRYLIETLDAVYVAAVEPAESPIISQTLRGEGTTPGPHGIQGIGANFIPDTLDIEVLDAVEHVTTEEAIAMARRLAAEEGLLVGISTGANVVAAMRLATRAEFAGSAIVTVAPSSGERYLSTPLWEGMG